MAQPSQTGPVVLVSGASQGIGAAIARVFAAEIRGVRLALIARNPSKLEEVARACRRRGARAEVFPCDVSDEASVEAMAAAVGKTYGRLDVLINNAGEFYSAPFLKMRVSDFDRMLAVNLRSVFLVTRAFAPGMVRRDIFNMSSIAGLEAFPGGSGYSAAKFGVAGLSKVMRTEFKGMGVRVCCIYPGATLSPSWRGSGVPAARLMPASDLARAFLEVYRLSRRTVVEAIVLRPQAGDL
jgi:NAD(P)-dependent dehydrogenase (short-subunit alcohol dehydrogenase family)